MLEDTCRWSNEGETMEEELGKVLKAMSERAARYVFNALSCSQVLNLDFITGHKCKSKWQTPFWYVRLSHSNQGCSLMLAQEMENSL